MRLITKNQRFKLLKRINHKLWSLRNKEKKKYAHRKWYLKHRERAIARSIKWAQDNPEQETRNRRKKSHRHDLKRSFGVEAPEFYAAMFLVQEGRCAICGKHQVELKRKLCLDHCHHTKKLRGLLCTPCNTGIGMLGDSVTRLKLAIQYLSERG